MTQRPRTPQQRKRDGSSPDTSGAVLTERRRDSGYASTTTFQR